MDALCVATTNTIADSIRTVYTSRLCKPWKISDAGLSFLAQWESGMLNGINFQGHTVVEGFILKAYRDNRGIPTVACGHRITPVDQIEVGQTISLERARAFKRRDVQAAEHRLNRDVRVPLFQFEYDAAISIVFNSGANDGADELVKKLNVGRYDDLFSFILSYRIGSNPGLPPRRYSEARLFASGVYDASH
ncbi:lysozyme [Paraburkholderia bannensis]|uniref:lysozyme n=1 Tax=Paraburkholderia bannensis TaxID=765414 RepID=UPI0012EB634E|nr:lysozyme [Paraburkholderia bannensis]